MGKIKYEDLKIVKLLNKVNESFGRALVGTLKANDNTFIANNGFCTFLESFEDITAEDIEKMRVYESAMGDKTLVFNFIDKTFKGAMISECLLQVNAKKPIVGVRKFSEPLYSGSRTGGSFFNKDYGMSYVDRFEINLDRPSLTYSIPSQGAPYVLLKIPKEISLNSDNEEKE